MTVMKPSELADELERLKKQLGLALEALEALADDEGAAADIAQQALDQITCVGIEAVALREAQVHDMLGEAYQRGYRDARDDCSTAAELDADAMREGCAQVQADMRDRLTALRTPSQESPDTTEGDSWQPIETAPKGTWVLCCEYSGNPDIRSDYYAGFHMPSGEYWMSACGQYVTQSPEPTHWLPLPDPPGSTPSTPTIEAPVTDGLVERLDAAITKAIDYGEHATDCEWQERECICGLHRARSTLFDSIRETAATITRLEHELEGRDVRIAYLASENDRLEAEKAALVEALEEIKNAFRVGSRDMLIERASDALAALTTPSPVSIGELVEAFLRTQAMLETNARTDSVNWDELREQVMTNRAILTRYRGEGK